MKNFAVVLVFFVYINLVSGQEWLVQDIFDRDLTAQKIILVDWEGYMANPAIQLNITPPDGSSFPITLTLTANHPRLYFDSPSDAGATGPSKSVTFNSNTTEQIYISIFPDREDGDEEYTLTLNSSLGIQEFAIYVVDQDLSKPSIDFQFIFDYSEDTQYNFFGSSEMEIAEQATNDWAYFIEDMNFDLVDANTELTYIWEDNLTGGSWVMNSSHYSGFYIYLYGLQIDPIRSGGAPSNHAFQTIGGMSTGLRRSGSFNVDPRGNYNVLGWNTTITDDTWYLGTNLGDVPNDFYSISLHEIGHTLSFNRNYSNFEIFRNQGFVDDGSVVAYHGGTVPVSSGEHLNDGNFVIDRISKKGVFGSEYADEIPLGRWLITKLNLLVLEAVGYDIKSTSAFEAVNLIVSNNLPSGNMNSAYQEFIEASGGIPFYRYSIIQGALPNGLTLNSFTGEISGTPSEAGDFSFTVRVEDYDFESNQKNITLSILPVLPIVLTNFNATLENNEIVVLNWNTHSEINNKLFSIEHSTDGYNFTSIGSVAGNGTTSNVEEYEFNHLTPSVGLNYYRLVQEDFDGTLSYSKALSITLNSQEKGIENIYPNPFYFNNFTIEYSTKKNKETLIEISDINGRIVHRSKFWSKEGHQKLRFNVAEIKRGTYFVKLSCDQYTSIRKLVKM